MRQQKHQPNLKVWREVTKNFTWWLFYNECPFLFFNARILLGWSFYSFYGFVFILTSESSNEFQGPFTINPWSELPVVPHYIVLSTSMSSRDYPVLTHNLNSLWCHITLYCPLAWALGITQYSPTIWTPCGATLHCTLHSHEFQGPLSTNPWSELPVVTHYIVLYPPMSSRSHLILTHDLNTLWCHITLYSTLPWVPGTIQILTSSAVDDSADVGFRDDLLVHDKQQQHCYTLHPVTRIENIIWCLLQGVNTNHPDFVLSNGDTSIKVTVLPLIYTVHPWFEHREYALMQK